MTTQRNKGISKTEERYFIKKIASNYDRDDTILALKRALQQSEFENGVLKSELDELKEICKGKIKSPNSILEEKQRQNKLIIKEYQSIITELQHCVNANNIYAPERVMIPPKQVVTKYTK